MGEVGVVSSVRNSGAPLAYPGQTCAGAPLGRLGPSSSARIFAARSLGRRRPFDPDTVVTAPVKNGPIGSVKHHGLSQDAKQLCRLIGTTKRPIIFLLGSALTQPEHGGAPGVANVRAIAGRLRDKLGEFASPEFSRAYARGASGASSFVEAYKRGFQELRDQDAADELIREAVLDAYTPLSDTARTKLTASEPACARLTIKGTTEIDGWYLRPSVVALGQLLASNRETFPRVLTTNFDPLIEIAIDRAGGTSHRSKFSRDGNPDDHDGDGTQVVHVHGYWYGTDTLHTGSQLSGQRTQLESTLKRWTETAKVVVLGYSGWDDVVTRALHACTQDGSARPDINWAFYEKEDPHVMKRLKAAGARVQAFEHVDMHRLLPALRDMLKLKAALSGFGPKARKLRSQWLDPAYEHLEPGPELAGARLLMPRYGVVRMTGRDTLLEDISTWCDGGGLKIRLVTGQGGQGKSRLLRELCKRQDAAGWTAGLVQREPMNLDAVRAEVEAGRACLFAVDYAETWGTDLVELLVTLHRAADPEIPLRVVLAARAKADWWKALRAKAPEVRALDALGVVVPLPPPDGDPAVTWEEAVTRFQKVRGREVEPVPRPSAERMNAWLEQGVLTLHVAALLASEGELPAGDERVALFDALLEREEAQFWEPKGEMYVRSVDDRGHVLAQVAALATLVGPVADKETARAWLSRLPVLQGLAVATLNGLVRVLAELYPLTRGHERGVLPTIQPDRIGEHLVAREVKEEPGLALLAFEHGSEQEAARALRVLGRAASWHEEGLESLVLSPARQHPLSVVRAWITVAGEEPWAGGLALKIEEAVGTLDGLSPDEAAELCDRVPLESVALGGIGVALAERSTMSPDPNYVTGDELMRKAKRLDSFGNRLQRVGRHKKAAEVATRSVQLLRLGHSKHPLVFAPNLAVGLANLGQKLVTDGEAGDGLDLMTEASQIFTGLDLRDSLLRNNFAMTMNNCSLALLGFNMTSPAMAHARLAVKTSESLTHSNAICRSTLANCLAQQGDHGAALEETLQVVHVYKQLAENEPDLYSEFLAGNLGNLGTRHAELKEYDRGLGGVLNSIRARASNRRTAPRPESYGRSFRSASRWHGSV